MQSSTAAEIARLMGAQVLGDFDVLIGPDVVIDSRSVSPGALFVALPGDRVDGHDFAAAAVAAGAAAVLVSRELPIPVTQLVVPDTAQALAALATGVVSAAISAGLVTVAITGSSGKTSTKDLIAQLLAAGGDTVAPAGSQNNEIGVPLTATRVDAKTRFLVSEFGARGLGHVRWLCGIVPPHIAVVVNVGEAHLGEFGNQETIARAKGELVEALPADGWAVLNAQDVNVVAMAQRTEASIAAFAVGVEPEFGALRVWSSGESSDERLRESFTLHASGLVAGAAAVQLRVSGAHQVGNALAAAAVALIAGRTLTEVADGLSQAEAKSRWRMELSDARCGALVVNDAYNANPDSMAAALQALAGMRRPGGRLVAVLGDMLELGPAAADRHRRIGENAAQVGVDELIVLGEYADQIAAGAASKGLRARVVADSGTAGDVAVAMVRAADVVLVKASRGLALESVAQRLAEAPGTESEQ